MIGQASMTPALFSYVQTFPVSLVPVLLFRFFGLLLRWPAGSNGGIRSHTGNPAGSESRQGRALQGGATTSEKGCCSRHSKRPQAAGWFRRCALRHGRCQSGYGGDRVSSWAYTRLPARSGGALSLGPHLL